MARHNSSLSPRWLRGVWLLALGMALLISGCGSLGELLATPSSGTPLASPVPSGELPTVIAQTLEADGVNDGGETAAGVVQATNTPVLASPLPGVPLQPSPTAPPIIPSSPDIPDAVIKIYRPGPYSKVTSPLEVVANLPPGADGKVTIELLGEDGRLLVRKIVYHDTLPGKETANLVESLEFEIQGLAESARLALSIVDGYGRTYALASVNLVLLSSGLSQDIPAPDTLEDIVIQNPGGSVTIEGDTLLVSGLARTQSDKLLLVEIVDREGKVLGWAQAAVIREEGKDYGLFVAEIKFEVDEPTWVLVVVTEQGKEIPGVVHISSVEIVVAP